jgi:6-phosphofructokinase 2
MRILTLCVNPALDKSVDIDHVAPDQKLRTGPPEIHPGGGGVNVARAIRLMGGHALVFHLSGGLTGDIITQLLEEEGVSQHRVQIEGNTRESFTVNETLTAHEYRFSTPGAEVREAEWHHCLDVVFEHYEDPTYLVASGSIPPGVPDDFYARVAKRARALGISLIVDASGEALRQAVDAGVFLIKPNLRELGHLAGEEIKSEEHEIRVAEQLVGDGKVEIVVVSLGAGGALLVTQDHHEHIRTPTVDIKSRVGAGDTMVGGITLALARGWPVREAARYGVAAGSATVMTPGTELCRQEDVARLYARLQEEH